MIADELTDERLFIALPPEQQKTLIAEYCSGMNERIVAAQSKAEARNIVEEQCKQFDSRCESAVIRALVKTHVQRILAEQWG